MESYCTWLHCRIIQVVLARSWSFFGLLRSLLAYRVVGNLLWILVESLHRTKISRRVPGWAFFAATRSLIEVNGRAHTALSLGV